MTDLSTLPQQIEDQLQRALSVQDTEVKILVWRDNFSWLRLSIVTTAFEKKVLEEREDQINEILDPLNLTLYKYPIADCKFLTPQEDLARAQFAPVQVPVWSDILFATDPGEPIARKEDHHKYPFIVTFYSFKGGVGRSTSLAFVANILTSRGYRVVMIDFDLEDPGLSFTHLKETSGPNTLGVIDYIYQRYITPDRDIPKIDACIHQIDIPTHGELFLIPAGEYNEGYIHRLSDLRVRSLYHNEVNPIHQLLKDVKSTLEPDIVLIDAHPGFTEMGAIALFDQADLGIICFSPTDQSFAGLELVVKAASKQRKTYGIPDLRFLLTSSSPAIQTQQQQRLKQTADWITQHWEVPSPVPVNELYYPVPYNPGITTLESHFTEVPIAILGPYAPVADAISASLRPESL